MLRLNEVIMGCLFFFLPRMSAGEGRSSADTRACAASSGSGRLRNPAGLFTSTGMQKKKKDPIRGNLKRQNRFVIAVCTSTVFI